MRINGGSGGDGVRSTGINGGNGGSSSVAGINGGEGGSSSAAGINGGDGGSSSAVGMNGGDGATATAMAVLLVASDVPSPIRLLRSRGVPERNGPPPHRDPQFLPKGINRSLPRDREIVFSYHIL